LPDALAGKTSPGHALVVGELHGRGGAAALGSRLDR